MNSINLNTDSLNPIIPHLVGNHFVQICSDETSQAEILTNYIREGLLNDEAVIVVARTALRKTVISKLCMLGFDMQVLKSREQVKFFDAEFMLSDLLLDGVLDEQAFKVFIELPVQASKIKYGKVRAFGEMVDLLWQNGQSKVALQLEKLWSDLCKREKLNRLCTYFLSSLDPDSYDHSLEHICECHTHLVSMNDSSNSNISEAMLSLYEKAWNRVINKLEKSHQILKQASV